MLKGIVQEPQGLMWYPTPFRALTVRGLTWGLQHVTDMKCPTPEINTSASRANFMKMVKAKLCSALNIFCLPNAGYRLKYHAVNMGLGWSSAAKSAKYNLLINSFPELNSGLIVTFGTTNCSCFCDLSCSWNWSTEYRSGVLTRISPIKLEHPNQKLHILLPSLRK